MSVSEAPVKTRMTGIQFFAFDLQFTNIKILAQSGNLLKKFVFNNSHTIQA
jgi:hypothetical protein